MKTISNSLAEHFQQDVTTLATCWRLERRDGLVMGFTDHDQPITFENIIYEAASGFLPTAISSSAQLNVDNLDIEGMLTSGVIEETDIIKGLYDFAEIEVFQLNYADTSQGKLMLRVGWIGEIRFNGDVFVAEIRGLTQKLSQRIGALYSPTCRAALGDMRCKLDMSGRLVTGSLTAVTSASVFRDTSRLEEVGRFAHGVITFTSGANEGVSMEVKAFADGEITLMLPLPAMPVVGDNYSMSEGCDKYFATCINRFNNAVNFRGEPHLAGLDRMLQTASTR